jgi:hypothetical protein
MMFSRTGNNTITSPEGYTVLATKVAGQWVYCAFAPEIPFAELKQRMKPRYEVGEFVPLSREQLGCFRGNDALAAAKAECESHHAPGGVQKCK